MDDEQTVNRRDAVAGVSLIGALLVAIVGSLASRVLDRRPGTPGPGSAVASQAAPAVSSGQALVNPTPTPVTQDADVRRASINDEAARYGTTEDPDDLLPKADELFPPEEGAASSAPAPRFVAPGQ